MYYYSTKEYFLFVQRVPVTVEDLQKFQSIPSQQLDDLNDEVVSLPIPATPVMMWGRPVAAASGAGVSAVAVNKEKEKATERAGVSVRKRRH